MLERSIEIDVPAERLFRFHLDTRNAPRVSPRSQEFLSIEGRFPLREGDVVEVKVRQAPIPLAQTWRIRVEAVVPNRALVDVALDSPFPEWRHEHRFEPIDRERTRLTDRVTYRLPGGPLGPVIDRLVVRRMLQKTFEARQRNTKTLLEAR